jgi:hypothetical protein
MIRGSLLRLSGSKIPLVLLSKILDYMYFLSRGVGNLLTQFWCYPCIIILLLVFSLLRFRYKDQPINVV